MSNFDLETVERVLKQSARIETWLKDVRHDMVVGFSHAEYRDMLEALNTAWDESSRLWFKLKRIRDSVYARDHKKE